MKGKVRTTIIVFSILFIVGCGNELDFEQVVNLKKGFNPSYKIQNIKDNSYAEVSRKSIKITVPKTLSQSDLEMNIRYAARDIYVKYKPKAIAIMAYKEGSDIKFVFDAAEAYFAPFGDWSRANEQVKLDQYKLTFKISNRYYEEPKEVKILKKGEKVDLIVGKSESINLSRSSDTWGDENIILTIKKTSSAEILGSKQIDLGVKDKLLRYQIKLNYNNKSYQGWIHSWDIKSEQQSK